ncbi:MAG: Plug domain-containing protein [Chryseobacterium sp.]|nr:MAG: Plug domain-containing protein [Chryseobacterium sp.]
MRNIYRFLLLFFVPLIALLSFSAEEPFENFLKQIEAYGNDNTSEKVHLHFDKPYYSIGDELWFKGYVVNTNQNELSTRSKVLYIDIKDDQDSLRKKLVLPLANGLCFGSVRLTDSLVDEGRYHIVAYTKYMLNFDQDFLFNKDILIGDANTPSAVITNSIFKIEDKTAAIKFLNLADSSPVALTTINYSILLRGREIASGKTQTNQSGQTNISIPKNIKNEDNAIIRTSILKSNGQTIKEIPIKYRSSDINVQFFPESGRLVSGIRSKLAIKAIGANGLGVNVTGYIIDQNKNRVLDFKTEYAGMGIVAINPGSTDQYTAVITQPEVTNHTFKLPIVNQQGYVLSLNHIAGENLAIKISAAEQPLPKQVVHLVALQNGAVKFASKILMNNAVVNSVISKSKFSTGIVQFTLFNAENKPLAERLVFVNRESDYIQLKMDTQNAGYGKRERIELNLESSDHAGIPVTGSFSVAVTNTVKVNSDEAEEMTILSNFLLTSDLKGYIERPNYYFHDINPAKMKHLDYLMLTQGWRRFNWAYVSENRLPIIKYPAQKGLELTGLIVNFSKKPVANGKVEVFANTTEGIIATNTVADDKGFFAIQDLMFSGNAIFTAKGTNTGKKRNVNILFDRPVAVNRVQGRNDAADFLNPEVYNYLKNAKLNIDALEKNNLYQRGIVLKDVEIKASYIEKNIVKGSRKLGNAVADVVITKDQLKNYGNIVQAFYNIPGVQVIGNGVTDAIIALVTRTSITGGVNVMKVFLDGGEIAPEMLKDIPPASIEGIEILKRGNAAIYNAQGVILITSKSGSDVYYSKYALNSYPMQGYHLSRDFYSPVYEKQEQNKIPDFRSTIFWKPDLVTNEQGKASFSFYTADEPGQYKVVIEGLDINGRLARKVAFIEVK